MRFEGLGVAFLLIAFVAVAHAQSAPVGRIGISIFTSLRGSGRHAVDRRLWSRRLLWRSDRFLTDELGKPYQGERASIADADLDPCRAAGNR